MGTLLTMATSAPARRGTISSSEVLSYSTYSAAPSGLAHGGLERGAIEEYDAAYHAALLVFELDCGTTWSEGAAGLLRQ